MAKCCGRRACGPQDDSTPQHLPEGPAISPEDRPSRASELKMQCQIGRHEPRQNILYKWWGVRPAISTVAASCSGCPVHAVRPSTSNSCFANATTSNAGRYGASLNTGNWSSACRTRSVCDHASTLPFIGSGTRIETAAAASNPPPPAPTKLSLARVLTVSR